MELIDGHLDLAYLVLNGRDVRLPLDSTSSGCVSLPALQSGGVDIAFATIFTEPTDKVPSEQAPEMYRAGDPESAEAAGLRQVAAYQRLESEGSLSIVRTAADLRRLASGLNIVLLMEGADPITSPEDVARWYARGVRIVGLTWAAGTRYAGGNGSAPGTTSPGHYSTGPLTSMGVDMICALDDAGIIHDASHLSDASFDGVMEHARGPIIASHSNCRVLVEDRQRHLRDDQIRAIVDRGGVIGLNLYTRFLVKERRATIDDCLRHIEHICEIAGHRRAVALGSDADGGFGKDSLPYGLDHPSKWPALVTALATRGWNDRDISGFARENWLSVLLPALERTGDQG